MPAWLDTILNVILFLFCLSTLVMVHEAGHFTAAKMFGVYCDDFSIGFGKAFFHKKRKRGETYFSLRVIPFGGFVSMAGEDGELPSGKQVPITRSIKGIKKWKTAIIMSAGVIMNCVLSLVLFYVSNQFFPTVNVYVNAISISDDSIASESGLKTFNPETGEGNRVTIEYDNRPNYINNGSQIWYYSYENYDVVKNKSQDDYVNYATFVKDNVKTNVPVLGLVQQSKTNIKNTSLDNVLEFYQYMTEIPEGINDPIGFYANFEKRIDANTIDEDLGVVESITFKLNTFSKQEGKYFCDYLHEDVTNPKYDEENNFYYVDVKINNEDMKAVVYEGYGLDTETKQMTLSVNVNENDQKVLANSGIEFYSTVHSLSYTEAVSKTFSDFGNGSIAIFKAIGSLFIGQGWENVGSIVAIYTQSSSVLGTMGIEYFIYLWALISVNLAIFNLLPFPGLDGWQLLVLAIEGITRKKVPDKAKAIASYIGIGLLMVFMFALIVKDIFAFF